MSDGSKQAAPPNKQSTDPARKDAGELPAELLAAGSIGAGRTAKAGGTDRQRAAAQINRSLKAWRSKDSGDEPAAAPAAAADAPDHTIFRAPGGPAFDVNAAKPTMTAQMRSYITNFGLAGIDRSKPPEEVAQKIVQGINYGTTNLESAWFETVRAGRVAAIPNLASATTAQKEQLIAWASTQLANLAEEICLAQFAELRVPSTSFVKGPRGTKGFLTYTGYGRDRPAG